MATPSEGQRAKGTGSLYREASGYWAASIEVGQGGRRRRRVIRGRSKAAVRRRLAEAIERRERGLAPTDGTTTGAWLEWWADNLAPRKVNAKTAHTYGRLMANHVIPVVGRVPLSRLRAEHVVKVMATMEAKGLGPATVGNVRTVLGGALTDAQRMERVTTNAAKLAPPPKAPGPRIDDALTAEEAQAVLTAAKGDRLEALAALALYTGMRQHECLDLRWSAVSLEGPEPELRIPSAKTDSGVRPVALPAVVAEALRAHRAAQRRHRLAIPPGLWVERGYVFTTPLGARLDRRAVLTWWHALTIRAGVGRRRFHATRHTAATLMLNNGVPLEVVSKVLGHGNLSITADVYAKVLPKAQHEAAKVMNRVLGG